MNLHDIHNRMSFLQAVKPQTQTNSSSALVSAIIDCRDALATEFVIMTGVLSDADAVYSVLLEEGDDSGLSDNTAVDDKDMLPSGTGQEAAAGFIFSDDGIVRKLGYVGIKSYVRLTITPTTTANSGDTPIAILVVQTPRTRGNVTGS